MSKMAIVVNLSAFVTLFISLTQFLSVSSLPKDGTTTAKETWMGRALWENDIPGLTLGNRHQRLCDQFSLKGNGKLAIQQYGACDAARNALGLGSCVCKAKEREKHAVSHTKRDLPSPSLIPISLAFRPRLGHSLKSDSTEFGIHRLCQDSCFRSNQRPRTLLQSLWQNLDTRS